MNDAGQPEIHHLVDLVRAWANATPGPVRPPSGLDPEAFLRLLAGHPAVATLMPLADRAAFPAGEWDRLQRSLTLAHQRTTWMLLELERILPALNEAGLEPVVLKGSALALSVYPRPEDRWFMDLDILLTRPELPTAFDTLEKLGYHRHGSASLARAYDQHHFHRILRSPHGVFLEVHWALTLPHSVYSFDLAALRRDVVDIPLGRTVLRGPSAVDQILHGVLQSIANGFGDLRRILDLHLLDRQLTDAQRQQLVERAEAAHLSTGLWLEYRVREELLGAAMPTLIARTCRPTPGVLRLVERLDVSTGCLVQRVAGRAGYAPLLHWVCTPARLRPREVRRYLLPDAEEMFLAGCQPEKIGHLPARLRVMVERLRTGGRILGYLARSAV